MDKLIEPLGFLLKELLGFGGGFGARAFVGEAFDDAGLVAVVQVFGEVGCSKAALADGFLRCEAISQRKLDATVLTVDVAFGVDGAGAVRVEAVQHGLAIGTGKWPIMTRPICDGLLNLADSLEANEGGLSLDIV